ncbi:hypothetical protein [Roseisolibacter sp. H3M3-2]|uniref:hypothetical protein n=1 Tax=Roseisolibacter sp. H3M3-2 TaxID=3031323 RepID=UPI0023DAB077|nr:hypothetical protein [Roseisolibacter sp. H3M3-2]MDF1504044.1 hypothetical protein [Roseisolibacter sp. H3M3-2]MDF1504047.1 hypothetical protein [Roseisolibacter sp. H3M3-2]
MDEWFPVVLGVLWGALVSARGLAAAPVLGAGAVAVGLLAAYVSGELARSPWFALLDVALAALAAGTGAVAVAALRVYRRASARRDGS